MLKVTPPRVPHQLLTRKRLAFFSEPLRGYPLVLVQAPAGFGKTLLLAQWRLEHLAHGAVVAWLSAQVQDIPMRLVQALVLSLRQGAGRPNLGSALLDAPSADAREVATGWLAEVAQTAMDTTLFVDEADHLPPGSVDLLVYLMRNAPPNLRVVVAARPELKLPIEDLVQYGQCRVICPSELRFQLDETLALVGNRFGSRVDHDTAARLHETVEGWPLGLQLALAAISSSSDPQIELAALTRQGGLQEQLVGLLLSNLEHGNVDFLTRIAIVDDLQPELCQAITGEDDAPGRLARLARDTPILTSGEHGEWLRMHQVVRDVLRHRFGSLPAKRQAELHGRAARWLAEHGLLEAAARHALISGQHEWAYHLAERSLYRDFMTYGKQGVVLEWLGRLPPEEVDRRPRLLLVAAWALANSGRHAEGARLVSRIVAQPDIGDALRCECDIILSAAAYFGDDPDRFVELNRRWEHSLPLRDAILIMAYQAQASFCDVFAGEPALARLRLQQSLSNLGDAHSHSARWGEFAIGLTYLREGQVLLAERQLRSTLATAEADFGRRSYFTCMVAALLAAALWEMDCTADADVVLANRLDVLEQFGTPETVILGYRTMARIALAARAEHRALALLDSMYAVGVARGLPSVCVASLVGRVRVHVRQFRAESCRVLADQLDTFLADPALKRGPIWWREAEVQRHLVQAYTDIAAQNWRRALGSIDYGEVLARQMQDGRLRIEFLGLRALAIDRCGENAADLLREAADLAQAYGFRRVFVDAHPMLADLVRRVAPYVVDSSLLVSPQAKPALVAAPRARIAPSMALTPKEREVLELLVGNLTNKEIGLAMQVSDQAIKWHLKNLFAKLNAGTRKQLVQRASLLGLLEEPE
ncbi:LuxR family transcriptional regulator [Pseudomonas fluorescens]|nr:LuxR family transcriptional regulator [Pseudomonas fluorescens]